ncbi:hypothetical protein ACFVSW_21700 [Neobacillus sp. NPDC058068]|uniref:hypothetical protein n=1 Tax=Neobacillus sp. NPDC058068 TaxID=3346325 RepID=UPI0036DD9C60
MHFRHFLIPVLMVGAALFLPDNTFAEKNEHGGQQNSHKEHVQVKNSSEKSGNTAKQSNVPAKAENAKPREKTVVMPEQASKKQNGVKQQDSNHAEKQGNSKKSATTDPKTLPEQANGNGYGLSKINKTEKTVKAPGQEKSEAVRDDKRGQGKNKLKDRDKRSSDIAVKDKVEHPSDITVKNKAEHHSGNTVKNKSKSTRLVTSFEPKAKGSDLSVPKKVENFEPSLPVPPQKGNVPSSKEEIPNVDQVFNPTQRLNSPGGQSNERVSQGLQTVSFLEKWFEWNKYAEIKLVQAHFSRDKLLNNQWVNAPPSPPPQESSFIINR